MNLSIFYVATSAPLTWYFPHITERWSLALRRFTAACQRWSLFVNLGAGSVLQKCTHANVLPFLTCVQLCFQYNQVTRDSIRTCVLAHCAAFHPHRANIATQTLSWCVMMRLCTNPSCVVYGRCCTSVPSWFIWHSCAIFVQRMPITSLRGSRSALTGHKRSQTKQQLPLLSSQGQPVE